MAQATANFELGTLTNDVLVADAGSATAWDGVDDPGAGSCIYDNAHVHGTLAAKIVTAATGSAMALEWNTALGSPTEDYQRFYLYLTVLPSPSDLRIFNETGLAFYVRTTGVLRVFDNIGFYADTSNLVAINQWVRIESYVLHSATVGKHETKLFNASESDTPTETITSPANRDTGVSLAFARYGDMGGSDCAATFWLDDIVAGATSYPGPVPAAVPTFLPAQPSLRW